MNDNRVVVDASFVVMLLAQEPHTHKADSLAASWREGGKVLHAPALLQAEVTNALFKLVRRQVLSSGDASRLLRAALRSNIHLHTAQAIYLQALELADRMGRSAAYDTVYLALAERLDCALWTGDERFFNAARQAGVARVRWVGEADAPPSPSA